MEEQTVSVFLLGKENNSRPSWGEIAAKGTPSKVYWSLWDALVVKEGVLFKKWEAPDLKSSFLQIIPQKSVKRILEEAHDSSTGGHFGINKTLEKIRKRFY